MRHKMTNRTAILLALFHRKAVPVRMPQKRCFRPGRNRSQRRYMSDMTAKKHKRPLWYNLSPLNLPLPGLVSIFHRVSGLLLFLAIPFLIYALQLSLADQAGFDAVRSAMTHPLIRLVILALVWAISHHFCAGIRYLFLDIHKGIDLPAARKTSYAVLAVSLGMTVILSLIHISEPTRPY